MAISAPQRGHICGDGHTCMCALGIINITLFVPASKHVNILSDKASNVAPCELLWLIKYVLACLLLTMH